MLNSENHIQRLLERENRLGDRNMLSLFNVISTNIDLIFRYVIVMII